MSEISGSTVAAVSTPPGEGGIGVIRISGDNAIDIAERCFEAFSGKRLSALEGYRALYGRIISNGEVLDTAIALVFRAPHSYTGEDVVELSVHGGRLMVQSVLRAVFAAGALPAGRGEFSRRAYMNGKMDLARAESIMGLISADNETALRISRAALGGRTSREVEDIAAGITALNADLAAYSDFPDEDLPGLSRESFRSQLERLNERLSALISGYDAGRLIREGVECVIVGRPNVGKSTLMNRLSGNERSIVTELAGTTRDIIEETVNIGGITLRLSDTAGLRESSDIVEQAGVERARKKAGEADLILAVFDGSAPVLPEDTEILDMLSGKTVIAVLNKSDKGSLFDRYVLGNIPFVEISAKNGGGIEKLAESIAEVTQINRLDPSAAVLISERQRSCAVRAKEALTEALYAIDSGCTLDAVSVCSDDALAALLELCGKRVTDEVADEVFRRFCVGK